MFLREMRKRNLERAGARRKEFEYKTSQQDPIFKIESSEAKKSYKEVIEPNAVKEKIPFFESLGINLIPRKKSDEENMRSIQDKRD